MSPDAWEARVQALEAEGLTRSDAQSVADVEEQKGRLPMSHTMKLYHHKTDGGAEYLMDTFIPWKHNGKRGKEGTITDKTRYIVRIDGDITKDAELTIRQEASR